MKVIAATNNQHKVREIKQILKDINVEIISLDDEGICVNIDEIGSTFQENALIKARAIYKMTGQAVIADDSGLEVEALGGKPGIFSARYSGCYGADADEKNRIKLLEDLTDISYEDRNARFCCAIAFIFPDGTEIVEKGYIYGKIAFEERGQNGFGYDSLFIVDDVEKTMAELDENEKNSISHRANALQNLLQELRNSTEI